MPNYQNGCIYAIISFNTEKFYVGHTIQPLNKRYNQHIVEYNYYIKDEKKNYVTSFEIIELGETQIVLLENYPCDSRNELELREKYWIALYKDMIVNKNTIIFLMISFFLFFL